MHLIYKDTKHIRFYLSLPINSFIFLTLTPNITFLCTAVPVLFIALDIQHFLKPFTVTSGQMNCHAVVIHFD